MKKKIFALLSLVMTVMTASAYKLTSTDSEQGTIRFAVGGNSVTEATEGATVTIIVSPKPGWGTDGVTAMAYMDADEMRARTRTGIDPSLVRDIEVTPVEGKPNRFTFTMPAHHVEVSATFIERQMHSGDVNGDDKTNIADVVALTNAIIAGTTDLKYDINGDNQVTADDIIALVNFIAKATTTSSSRPHG